MKAKLFDLLPLWITWFAGYELLLWRGYDPSYWNTVTRVEETWPVIEWSVIFYVSTYPFVILTPFVVKDGSTFKEYLTLAWMVVLTGLLLQFALPFYAAPRTFIPTSMLGELIAWERAYDGPAAAFPSFHVLWVLLSAHTLDKNLFSSRWWAWVLALGISISCVTTGNHSVLDVAAAMIVFLVIVKSHVFMAWVLTRIKH